MDTLVNVANVLYLVSYSVRDILWLRILTVVAASLLIPYFYLEPDPLMIPIYWNLVFIGLNAVWIVIILRQRRPVQLTEEERILYRRAFRTLTPREMRNLLGMGEWKTAEAGTRLVENGKPVETLAVIVTGRASVEVNGETVDELEEGQFVGAPAFLDGEVAPVTVKTLEPVRCVSWKKQHLKKFLGKKPELAAAMELALGLDLTRMLKTSLAKGGG